MKHYLKLMAICVVRILMRVLYVFPIKKKRILFSSHEGAAYNCSPKYIFERLYQEFGNKCEYVWCINNNNKIPDKYNIICVKFLSFKHLYYLATAAVVISNIGIEPFVPKRKNRIFIHTTHGGGAYKKGLFYTSILSKSQLHYMKILRDWRSKATTYVISSCKKYSDIMCKEFNIGIEKFLPIGMPRNDLFFSPIEERQNIRKRICEQFCINPTNMIILYAPTYRGHWRSPDQIDLQFDTDKICFAVKQRFGTDSIMLYRCHLVGSRQKFSHVIDVSRYDDMQELLITADILITDYSSSIWDYSFTYKPGFLYTPDIDSYEKEVNFHTPISQWQYPYAKNIAELIGLIENYDEKIAQERIDYHHQQLGSYETGTATVSICEYIKRHIFQ